MVCVIFGYHGIYTNDQLYIIYIYILMVYMVYHQDNTNGIIMVDIVMVYKTVITMVYGIWSLVYTNDYN